jgi:aminoglycoside 3-N-acetyltransferase I
VTPVEVIRLGPRNVAQVRALNAMFAAAFIEDDDDYSAAPPSDAYLGELLGKPHVIVLAALAGQEVVGGVLAYELPKLEQARSEIYIYDLAVTEGWRRRGIATTLIEHVRRLARERGAWMVFVQGDHRDAPALALYDKLGRREEVLHFDIEP